MRATHIYTRAHARRSSPPPLPHTQAYTYTDMSRWQPEQARRSRAAVRCGAIAPASRPSVMGARAPASAHARSCFRGALQAIDHVATHTHTHTRFYRARLSLRAGTRRHGHARTQMNLRAARHAGTHLCVSRHPNSQASGHVNMQACQRDGRRWSGGKQRETEGDRETGGGRERQREAERGKERQRETKRGREAGPAVPCVLGLCVRRPA
jgi:hypothetical protein